MQRCARRHVLKEAVNASLFAAHIIQAILVELQQPTVDGWMDVWMDSRIINYAFIF